MRLALGFVTHPGLHVDAFAQGLAQVFHELQHALLRRGREVALHVGASQSHAQCTLNGIDALLPARKVLLGAAHGAAEEVEVRLTETVAQQAGGIVHHLEVKVGLEVGQVSLGKNALHLVNRFGLVHR